MACDEVILLEFGYFPFEELPPVTMQVVEEVIKCEVGNINIQHTDPIEINTDIHLPLKDDKLAKLQESDPHTTVYYVNLICGSLYNAI